MSKFSDTTKVLMDIMSKEATSDTASALRWVSRFLSSFISANLSIDFFFVSCHLSHLSDAVMNSSKFGTTFYPRIN